MFYAFQALLQWFSGADVGHCSAPFFLLCPEVLSGQSRKKGMFIFGLFTQGRTGAVQPWAGMRYPVGVFGGAEEGNRFSVLRYFGLVEDGFGAAGTMGVIGGMGGMGRREESGSVVL